jgi:hypothetical protein
MKIYEIEAGEKIDLSHEDFNTVMERIKIECSEAYNIYSTKSFADAGAVLMRGVKVKDGIVNKAFNLFKPKSDLDIYMGKPREDRKPMSLQSGVQKAIDIVFQQKGFTALRSNSIFCTSKYAQARLYGRVYVIYPKNGFSFTWSPAVSDLYSSIAFKIRERSLEFKSKPKVLEQFISEYIESKNYKNTDFEAALQSRNEVMVSGEFYAIDLNLHMQNLIDKAKLSGAKSSGRMASYAPRTFAKRGEE